MRHRLTACLFAFFWAAPRAQADVTTDHELRLDASIRTELVDGLKVQFTQNLRQRSQRQGGRQIIPELGLSYGFLTYFSVGLGGRYSIEKDNDGASANATRVQGDLEAKSPKMGRLKASYRVRVQRETVAHDDSKIRLRNKATLRLNTDSPVTPELFYEHTLDPNGESGHKAQKYRLGGGLAAKIDKQHRLKFRFFQDKEIDGDGDKTRVASIGYRYSF